MSLNRYFAAETRHQLKKKDDEIKRLEKIIELALEPMKKVLYPSPMLRKWIEILEERI